MSAYPRKKYVRHERGKKLMRLMVKTLERRFYGAPPKPLRDVRR